MKTITITLLTIMLCLTAYAQKPKLAVVIDGKSLNEGVYKQFSGQIVEFVSTKYAAVNRSAEVLKELKKEHQYQRDGAVSVEQIKALGKQFSVDYLCIISITKSISDYYLEAKLTNVETAEYTTATANSPLKSSEELSSAAKHIADKLLGVTAPKPAPAPTYTPAPTPNAVNLRKRTIFVFIY